MRQEFATSNRSARATKPQAVGMVFGIANGKFQIEDLKSAISHSEDDTLSLKPGVSPLATAVAFA
jgi:hypothetical protein